jgi:NADPH:quinone reductase-like Zn-dependent oxidoreductase
MKAVRLHRHGGPEVLQYEDAPDPVPQPGRAIVRVRACALNHLDLWQRRGIERVRIPLPHIPGSDVSGEVADAGGGPLPIGTRVLLQPGLSCGTCEACVEGGDNLCARFDVVGLLTDGGCAEYVSVPAGNLVAIPDRIGFVEAAAFPLTFLTAWHMLARAGLRAGDVVLVLAGGSGVGQAAIQVARALGARVLATSAPAKKDRTLALGAEMVFDHYSPDFARQARAATAGRGVDIVIEHVGQATWEQSVRALARGGRLVTCGATSGHDAVIDIRHLFGRQLSLIGTYMGRKTELIQAAGLFFAGTICPIVDGTLGMAEAAAAHARLEARQQFGKIVLVTDR